MCRGTKERVLDFQVSSTGIEFDTFYRISLTGYVGPQVTP